MYVRWSNGGWVKKVRQKNVGLEKNFLNKKNVGKEKIRGLRNPGGRKSVFVARSMGGGVSSNPEVRK